MSERVPYETNPLLPGADWPMLVHLLSARGYYRSTRAVASRAGISPNNMAEVLNGHVNPNRRVAAWLFRTARKHFNDADKALASVADCDPQWFSNYTEAKRSAAA